MKKALLFGFLALFTVVGIVNAEEINISSDLDTDFEILQNLSSIDVEVLDTNYDVDNIEVVFRIDEPLVYRGPLKAGFETYIEATDGTSQLIGQYYDSLGNIEENDGTYVLRYRLPNRIIESQSEAEVWFYIRTEDGLSLYVEKVLDQEGILLPLPSTGLVIRTCDFVTNEGEVVYKSGNTRVINESQEMNLSCRVINRSRDKTEVLPRIEIHERFAGGKLVKSNFGYGIIELEGGEIRDLVLPLPSINSSGLYNFNFTISSDEGNYIYSSYINNIVVRGKEATILSSLFYESENMLIGHVLWTGPADNFLSDNTISRLETPNMEIVFYDEKGELCGDEVSLMATNKVVSLDTSLSDDCVPAIVDISLTDNSGEVLDHLSTKLGFTTQSKGSGFFWYIFIFIILLLAVLAVVFLGKNNNDKNSMPWNKKGKLGVFLAMSVVVGVLGFFGADIVRANSHDGPVLTVEKQGDGTGTVTSSPSGINCGSVCDETYSAGQSITLTATPSAGMQFDGWGGDASSCGSNTTCVVTMGTEPGDPGDDVYGEYTSATASTVDSCDGNRDVSYLCSENDDFSCVDVVSIGNFCTKPCFNPSGGLCTSCPPGDPSLPLSCQPNSCIENFQKRDVECNPAVPADYDRNVIATFSQSPVTEHTIDVSKNGTGSGTVESDDLSINCGSLCSNNYPEGDNQTLMAIPDSGSTFVSWTNCPDPVGQTCNITNISQDYSITATFDTEATPTEYLLGTTVNGPGSVSSNPGGITCPTECDETYVDGTSVTLTATVDSPEDSFDGWGGDASGCGSNTTCVIVMNGDKDVTATFTLGAGDLYTVTTSVVNPHPEGDTKRAVRVYEDSDGDGSYEFLKTCFVNDCLQDIEEGIPARLTRSLCLTLCDDPDTSADFLGWIGPDANLCASQSAASCLFTMPSNSVTIRAEFTPQDEICGDGIDNDGDGQIDEGCNEICGDGIDNDGDGQIDEGCPPTVSCTVSPARAFIGEDVTWTANASGGDGTYTYQWFGSGNLAGRTGQTEVVSYQSPGNKWGQVEVTSGDSEPVLSGPCTNSENGTGVDIQHRLTTGIIQVQYSGNNPRGDVDIREDGTLTSSCGEIDPSECITGQTHQSNLELTFNPVTNSYPVFVRWVNASGALASDICVNPNALPDGSGVCEFINPISSDIEVKAEVRNTECWDGEDNDGDTETDYHSSPNQGDPQCDNRDDDNESGDDEPPAPQCSDGIDNDDPEDEPIVEGGDGSELADTADPGCHSDGNPDSNGDGQPDNLDGSYQENDNDETDEPSFNCSDGVDNDEDGKCDYDGCNGLPPDPKCPTPWSDGEGDDGTTGEF